MTPATPFVEIDHIDKVYKLPDGGRYIALKNIDLTIAQGEFVSLIGHSGCGKSTLLNIVAGLEKASVGGVILEGRQVSQPGPDRMVVFQNYSLLPWKTVYENIGLAVNSKLRNLSKAERHTIIEQNIDLVGLRHARDKYPHELSGGMKQRVAIARGLSIRPKVLLLDEPFGALDALTRGNLQQQLMQICYESHVTCIMVTHDVDEALLLSDRIVMLTNGPEASIGQILDVPIPRPRNRVDAIKHPSYYSLRNEMIYFLNQQKRAARRKKSTAAAAPKVAISRNGLEKVNLELGFIPLTDCAPLVVAQEKGFFQKHGLDVKLSREPSWKAISEGVTSGRLDGAQMVAGMPLALTLGAGNQTPSPTITAMVLSRNGSSITLSKHYQMEGVRTLADFKAFLQESGRIPTLGVVHPTSMQNLLLRYWLAAAGIDPDRDVEIVVIPPPQMVANLKAGNIDGYCVGEPWNSHAVHEKCGFVIQTDLDIWPGHPEKVLGVTEEWTQQNPKTQIALVKALIEACEYCDDRRNREGILELLYRPEYVGASPAYMRPGFLDAYNFGIDLPPQSLYRYNQFYIEQSTCPARAESLWIASQLARWDIAPFPKNWIEIVERVRRLDLYREALRQLQLPSDLDPHRQPFALFDGITFNPDDPLGYLNKLAICREVQVEEFVLEPPVKAKAA
jgi:nitrate/nitrite transport system ATP-binding protein